MAKKAKRNAKRNVAPAKARAAEAKALKAKPRVTKANNCCVNTYWAVVETDGRLVRGRNVKRVKRLNTGQYEVIFTGGVKNGVYQATIGRPGTATEPAGEIGVALRCCLSGSEVNRGVWVDTHDSTGKSSDRAFHLVVHTD